VNCVRNEEYIMKNMKIIAASLMMGGLLAGCASAPTTLEKNYGRSVETAKYNQMVDPRAGEVTGPVEGMDGQGAVTTLQGYRSGFESKKSSSSATETSVKK
jgi:hypothetical protein